MLEVCLNDAMENPGGADAGKDGQGKLSSIGFAKTILYRVEEQKKLEGGCCLLM